MDAIEAIYHRRAIRRFGETNPTYQELNGLIEAAIQAPSDMDRQPWAFVVISGRPVLARMSAQAKALLLSSAPSDPRLSSIRTMIQNETFNIFYDAPVLIVICATDAEAMSIKDCCLAAQNLMLAAAQAGLGTCWIGLAEPWLASPEARAELGLAADLTPVAPIIVGRPADHPIAPPRHKPRIHWVGSGPTPL